MNKISPDEWNEWFELDETQTFLKELEKESLDLLESVLSSDKEEICSILGQVRGLRLSARLIQNKEKEVKSS